jgi:hypothetical protein
MASIMTNGLAEFAVIRELAIDADRVRTARF